MRMRTRTRARTTPLGFIRLVTILLLTVAALAEYAGQSCYAAGAPAPLLKRGYPSVIWWFVFKFNSKAFPNCGAGATRQCTFGGHVQNYKSPFGQQFVYASSENPSLQKGNDCVGDTTTDPLGATFDEIYNGSYYYVIWNDQFYDDPSIAGCSKSCSAPWGHSKGMLAWNDSGEGVVLQVTTPSWPASGSERFPRKDGNTLGCVSDDNDVEVSQHFFALKLTKDDVVEVLKGLQNASVVTDPGNPQIVNNGGPADIKKSVEGLGKKSTNTSFIKVTLSSKVVLISKPSRLHVPPWQMVSALLGGVGLRAATWWTNPEIPPTTAASSIECWDPSLGSPGPVAIATSGQWDGKEFGLKGGLGPDFNHAKIGVATSGAHPYAILGDLNQQGTVSGPNCSSSQNGRGGLFYVIDNPSLSNGVTNLINGRTAPAAVPSD